MHWRPESGASTLFVLWGMRAGGDLKCVGVVQFVEHADKKPWHAVSHDSKHTVRFRYMKQAKRWCESTAKLAGYE